MAHRLAIQKLKNQLDDVPDNGTSDTETHENREAQQLRIERSMKASQSRKRERTSDDAEQERESDCEKNHNAQSMTNRENKQHTRWKWLPNPTPQIAPYKEQATPQNSQNYIPADADKNKKTLPRNQRLIPKAVAIIRKSQKTMTLT